MDRLEQKARKDPIREEQARLRSPLVKVMPLTAAVCGAVPHTEEWALYHGLPWWLRR